MSKAHRGTGLKEAVKGGRGTCPVCKRTGIKTLYEIEQDGNKLNVCKECSARAKKAKKSA